jgi:hypothetical protein
MSWVRVPSPALEIEKAHGVLSVGFLAFWMRNHFSQSGQASGGQSGGQSEQQSGREQVDSVLTEGTAGSGDAALLAKLDAAKAPAAINGIPTNAHQSHFLLLMFSPFWKLGYLTDALNVMSIQRILELRGLTPTTLK